MCVCLGILGSGGIYMVDSSLSTASVTNFYNLDANAAPTRSNAAAGAPAYGNTTSYTIPVTAPTGISINYLGAVDPYAEKERPWRLYVGVIVVIFAALVWVLR